MLVLAHEMVHGGRAFAWTYRGSLLGLLLQCAHVLLQRVSLRLDDVEAIAQLSQLVAALP